MDYASLAKQFGGGVVQQPQQPQQTATPDWMGGLSPKDQAELQMKMHSEGRKRIAELDESITTSSRTMDMLNRFGQLNQNSRTGDIHERLFPTFDGLRGDDEKEMIAIQNQLGPKMRETGSGASSDRDVSMFLSSLPGIDKPGNVNKNIRENFKGQYDKAVSKRTAMESYLYKNGTLTGFDDAWAARNATPAKTTQSASMPKSKAFKLDGGGSVMGTLGPDGNYYVTRNGKRFKVEE